MHNADFLIWLKDNGYPRPYPPNWVVQRWWGELWRVRPTSRPGFGGRCCATGCRARAIPDEGLCIDCARLYGYHLPDDWEVCHGCLRPFKSYPRGGHVPGEWVSHDESGHQTACWWCVLSVLKKKSATQIVEMLAAEEEARDDDGPRVTASRMLQLGRDRQAIRKCVAADYWFNLLVIEAIKLGRVTFHQCATIFWRRAADVIIAAEQECREINRLALEDAVA
jgi:hypothetical protein